VKKKENEKTIGAEEEADGESTEEELDKMWRSVYDEMAKMQGDVLVSRYNDAQTQIRCWVKRRGKYTTKT
jgi:hypothetical protein